MRGYILLRENLARGDQKAIAHAIGKHAERVNLMLKEPPPYGDGLLSPVDDYFNLVGAVRSTGNVEGADRIHLAMSEELGFVSYKITAGYSDDVDFAKLLRKFSDVVDERAKAESPDSPGGKIRTPEERRAIVADVRDLIAAAFKYVDDQESLADADERRHAIRRRA